MTSLLKYNAKNFVGQCHILQVVVSYNFLIKSRATATGQKCDFATGQKCKTHVGHAELVLAKPPEYRPSDHIFVAAKFKFANQKNGRWEIKAKKNSLPKIDTVTLIKKNVSNKNK